MPLKIQRIYDRLEGEGARKSFKIFVDRLWARGIKKEQADIDLWLKDVAPSDKLRKWFGHDPEKWCEFRRMYFRELDDKQEMVEQILQRLRSGDLVILLYGAKENKFNNAVALREYLLQRCRDE